MTDKSSLFFSIIIPTRNRPQIFSDALNSVFNQEEKSFEIIVVNDGSDNQYLAEYEKLCQSKEVTLLHLEQSMNGHGPSYGLNMGVNIAKGQYIAFLDDDDQWISAAHLSIAKKQLIAHSSDLYLSLQEAYKNNKLINRSTWLAPLTEILNSPSQPIEVNINSLIKSNAFAHRNNLIISKSLYLQINGHDENLRYEEDREFYLRAIEYASTIVFSPEFVSRHNIPVPNNNNLSKSYSELKKLRSRLYLFDGIITQSDNPTIINYVTIQKSYTLKYLAEYFYKEKSFTKALHYAKQAAFMQFSIKWILFTIYLFTKV